MVLVYITASTREEALSIGKALVEEKKAACINVVPGMESLYWWEGKIESSKEAILIAKTSEEMSAALVDRVKALHSYSCPCVLIVPITGGNPDYLNWLANNL